MNKNPEFTVNSDTTLLAFLLECHANKSRNYVKGILKRGQVAIDGKVTTDFARSLRAGQRVRILLHADEVSAKPKFPILYEDDDLLVIDKPAGLLSISTDKERETTAYHMVTDYVKACSVGGRVFVVHRLDRETSGVLLFAKSETVKLALQDDWDANIKRRGYVAVVEGAVEPKTRTISSWLKQTKTLLVYSSAREGDGKLAITNYNVVNTADKYSLLDISLETGRKNQIRVHMKDIGHPVAGDKKYGAKTDPIKRLALHASALTLTHPTTGAELRLEARVPSAFSRLFASKSAAK